MISLLRLWVNGEEGRRKKFRSLEVGEASSSHLKNSEIKPPLLLLKFHVCETKWTNIGQLTVFICFAIEQEFYPVVVIVIITQSE